MNPPWSMWKVNQTVWRHFSSNSYAHCSASEVPRIRVHHSGSSSWFPLHVLQSRFVQPSIIQRSKLDYTRFSCRSKGRLTEYLFVSELFHEEVWEIVAFLKGKWCGLSTGSPLVDFTTQSIICKPWWFIAPPHRSFISHRVDLYCGLW